jgi:twitching motility protein PilT
MVSTPSLSAASAPPAQSPASDLLEELLRLCIRRDASDLHLAPGLQPYLRVEGVLQLQTERDPVSSELTEAIAGVLIRPYNRAPLETTGSLDGAFTGPEGARFRFNVFRRQGQFAIAVRRLEDRFRSLHDLGLPESLYQLCDLPDGLVIVCGPTGAGKSTTLATLLDRINHTRRCHIVTIEDPIEYLHHPVQSLVNQRQVGGDTSSFNDALVASLRQDPDVILVGEIRDLATIRTAITAAETGHLVLTTVHASDCAGAVERLVAVFPADEQGGIRRQLSMVLRAILAQHLLVADGPAGLLPAAPNRDGTSATSVPPSRRRVVASEVLMITPAIANLVATAKSNLIYSAMETGSAQGMQTIEQDLARLWAANLISETIATAMARNPAVLRDRLTLARKAGARPGGGGR